MGWRSEVLQGLDPIWHASATSAIDSAVRLADTWNFDIEASLPGATCSIVLAASRGSEELVLKVPLSEEERGSGFEAALAFSGHGGVTVLEFDRPTGATLLPRMRPGLNLDQVEMSDVEACSVAAELMGRLHRAELTDTWTHERWFECLWAFQHDDPTTAGHLDRSKRMARRLLESPVERRLLHGDLHHFNILKHGNDWLAIDPKGVLADPAFEPVAFLRNPAPRIAQQSDLAQVQSRRILQFAQALDAPAERVWAWAVCQIGLDAAWGDDPLSVSWRTVLDATLEARPPDARGWL